MPKIILKPKKKGKIILRPKKSLKGSELKRLA